MGSYRLLSRETSRHPQIAHNSDRFSPSSHVLKVTPCMAGQCMIVSPPVSIKQKSLRDHRRGMFGHKFNPRPAASFQVVLRGTIAVV